MGKVKILFIGFLAVIFCGVMLMLTMKFAGKDNTKIGSIVEKANEEDLNMMLVSNEGDSLETIKYPSYEILMGDIEFFSDNTKTIFKLNDADTKENVVYFYYEDFSDKMYLYINDGEQKGIQCFEVDPKDITQSTFYNVINSISNISIREVLDNKENEETKASDTDIEIRNVKYVLGKVSNSSNTNLEEYEGKVYYNINGIKRFESEGVAVINDPEFDSSEPNVGDLISDDNFKDPVNTFDLIGSMINQIIENKYGDNESSANK